MNEKGISRAVITRLPRYYRYLGELLEEGVERISSRELSQRMNVTASQIRQDLNNFGGFGQQGYGYNVRYLRGEIAKILGLHHDHSMIIVGAGNVGQALAKYQQFPKLGLHFIALFDIREEVIGTTVGGLPVYAASEIPAFLASHDVDIAALTLPKEAANKMAEVLAENGIHAIWNFAHTDLHLSVPDNVIVENVHLSESLMRLTYTLAEKEGR